MSDSVLLRVTDLSVSRGQTGVLTDVNLEVSRGEVVAVLGPNGAGKSTLLDTVGGLLAPTEGRVELGGRVATVMQQPGLARRTVRANVELALAWWGTPRRERRPRALEALELMRAGHLVNRPAAELSGGERRRVHLARAVAIRPDVLLLDEPFVGLDTETHAALCEDASSVLRASAGAVLLVVHDRSEAWAMADRIVIMAGGRVLADGAPRTVLEAPPTIEVARFLGYDGEVRDGADVIVTRPRHVRIDGSGDLPAVVTQVLTREDGVRLELDTGRGRLRAETDDLSHRVGSRVRLRLVGGVRFPDPVTGPVTDGRPPDRP